MTRTLRAALERLREGRLSARQCVALWRNDAPPLLAELSPRYGEVLEVLLMRLESGASFDGENCSFSQPALLAELGVWLDHAEARIARIRRA